MRVTSKFEINEKDNINFLDELKGKDNSPSKANAAKDIFAKYRKK